MIHDRAAISMAIKPELTDTVCIEGQRSCYASAQGIGQHEVERMKIR